MRERLIFSHYPDVKASWWLWACSQGVSDKTAGIFFFFLAADGNKLKAKLSSWCCTERQATGKYSLLGGFSLLSPVNFRGASGTREALEILHKYSDTVLVLLSGCDGCDWIICHTACCPSCIPQVTDLSTRKTNPQHWS